MSKKNLLRYKIGLIHRVKGECNPRDYSDSEIFFRSIKFKLPRAKKALRIFNKVIKENDVKLNNYSDLKKLEFLVISDLMKNNLYLYPTYIYYPERAAIITNFDCNFRCNHCFQPDFTKGTVNIKDVDLFLDKIKEVNINNIGIHGGESFLYFNLLKKIVKLSISKKIKADIISNGFWCKDKKKVKNYLTELKSVGFNGGISISLGIGHKKFYKSLQPFLGLKEISQEILGKNIFYFSFEDTSFSSYLKKNAFLTELKRKYQVRFTRIVPSGQGEYYKKRVFIENKNRYEYPNRLQCTHPKLLPNGRISLCDGAQMRHPRFITLKLNSKLSFKDIFLQENKRFVLWSRFKGFELIRCLEKEGRIKKEDYPHICLFCKETTKNPELIDIMYDKLVNKEKIF